MAIKIKNLRINPYTAKDTLKVIFGDEMHLTFEIPHVDGESYLCALDCDRILYPINRPVCAYTEVFTRDGGNVSFTLNLTTSKLRDYVSSIKKPMPVWLQIVREVNGKYETVLLDDILAIPSVIDGSMTVYEGDSFKELLDAKMNVPEAEGTDGQVLTMDADGHYSWQDLPEQEQADWDESDSSNVSYIKNKPNLAINDGKITVNQGGVKKGEFTVNQAGDTTIDLNDGAQSDWDESDSSEVSFIKNKPNLATVATSGSYNDLTDKPIITQPVNADWDESDSENLAYIFNKPTIPAAQIQSDWDESDSSDVAYIKNKPDLTVFAQKSELPPDDTDYLCFTAEEANSTVAIYRRSGAPTCNIEYSTDGKQSWTAYVVSGASTGTTITLANVGDKVYWRGDNTNLSGNSSQYHSFRMSGKIKATGNVMSLLSRDCSKIDIPSNCFNHLFDSCTALTSADVFPRKLGVVEGLEYFFVYCETLTSVEVPDCTLSGNWVMGSFVWGCSNLSRIKVHFHTWATGTNALKNWVNGIAATGTFECPADLDCSTTGTNRVPSGWTVVRTEAVQADWNQTDSTEASFIKNKPTIPAAQVQSDWDESDSSDVSFILNKPNVEDSTDYFCLTANQANSTVQINKSNDPDASSIEFSTNKKDWTAYTWSGSTGYQITLANIGDKVWWRGTGGFVNAWGKYYNFVMSGSFIASGNIMSFIDKTCKSLVLPRNYCFATLFSSCTSLISVENIKLPATTLTETCYGGLFSGCTNIKKAPKLPATTLTNSCYASMFLNCTSLEEAPELPAKTLGYGCYNQMFMGCSSLVNPTELPATTLTQTCYLSMFRGCTSLAKAPKLSATTMENQCYQDMFDGCASLTEAPELPATALAQHCYESMFYGCTGLTIAPELPSSASLPFYCYRQMFSGCTKLKYVSASFTSWDTGTTDWLANTYSKGVINCPNALEDIRDASHIPTNWIKTPSSNTPSNETLKKPWTSSATVFTVCPQGDKMYRINVSSTLTLNAMYVWDYAYAEIVLDVAAGATVTAGTNITFVDTPTAGKRNVCVVRWADQTAKLYVCIKEDLDASSSI